MTTKELITKIEKLAKSKIAAQDVVSLDRFRDTAKKIDPKTLLIIEDDVTMRKALQRIFESEGYQLKMAADAMELSTVLDDNPVDLILLDIGLPWINGFELAQLLKDHQDLKHIPLIFVSALGSQEDMKKAFSLGADDFIKKPFDVDRLKKTVKVLLKLNEDES